MGFMVGEAPKEEANARVDLLHKKGAGDNPKAAKGYF